MTPPLHFAHLAGRRAVVTGGSSGIGRAISLALAAAGADVLVHCRSSLQSAHEVGTACRNLGGRAHVLAADFATLADFEPFVAECRTLLGGLDIWVANAGVDLLTGEGARLSYADKLERLLSVDVRASMLSARAAGRALQSSGGGTILMIGWDQADRGMEGDSGELFAAAKNAVMGFTRSLALSLAPTVRVNCIAPGWIRTAWGEQAGPEWQARVVRETPLARWGTPEDVAAVARFLVSDEAAYLTGQVVNVNGGAVR